MVAQRQRNALPREQGMRSLPYALLALFALAVAFLFIEPSSSPTGLFGIAPIDAESPIIASPTEPSPAPTIPEKDGEVATDESTPPISPGTEEAGGATDEETVEATPSPSGFGTEGFSIALSYTTCEDIRSSGKHTLDANLVTNQVVCFNITASNVEFDCQGFNITGNRSSSSPGNLAGSMGFNASSRVNITIRNCGIFNFSDGIFFTRVRNGTIFNNTIVNNSDDGIDLNTNNYTVISHNFIANNTDNGIEMTGWFNNITNNTIRNNRGDVTSHGLQTFRAAVNVPGSGPATMRIINNTFIDNQNDGINTAWLNDSVIANNTIFGGGDDSIVVWNGTGINITGNNIGTGGDDGILLQGTNYSFISHNNVSERAGQNLDLIDANNNNLSNNTLYYGNIDVLRLRYASVNNTFWNTTIWSNDSWFTVNNTATLNNNFTNTTFANSNGSIRISFFQANITQEVNTTTLNISNNRSYLNATNLSFMNASAVVILNLTGLSFTTPEVGVDYGDTNTYVSCPASKCNASTLMGTRWMFNVSSWTSFRIQETPPAPVEDAKIKTPIALDPLNGSNHSNRSNINFNWSNSSTPNSLIPNYSLEISSNSNFSAAAIVVNVTLIKQLADANSTNFSSYNYTFDFDTTYWWRVIATNGTEFSNYSNIMNFSLQSVFSITLINRTVIFGNLSLGASNDTNDTPPAANSPFPLIMNNDGNRLVNVSVTGTRLWLSTETPFPGPKFRFAVRVNSTKNNSFNVSKSVAGWTNVPDSGSTVHIYDLLYNYTNNTAWIDLNITAPTDEPAGTRNSTLTFTIT